MRAKRSYGEGMKRQNPALYKRGQLEQALWAVFGESNIATSDPPPLFCNRVKKLLDQDRVISSLPGVTTLAAFSEGADVGQGQDSSYSAFDTFCLGIALHLAGAGFKQSEIIQVVRHSRAALNEVYSEILSHSYTNRMVPRVDFDKKLPTYLHKGKEQADPTVYMILNRVEPLQPMPVGKGKKQPEAVLAPAEYVRGLSGLAPYLYGRQFSQPTHQLVELSELAHRVTMALAQVPPTRRGRK